MGVRVLTLRRLGDGGPVLSGVGSNLTVTALGVFASGGGALRRHWSAYSAAFHALPLAERSAGTLRITPDPSAPR